MKTVKLTKEERKNTISGINHLTSTVVKYAKIEVKEAQKSIAWVTKTLKAVAMDEENSNAGLLMKFVANRVGVESIEDIKPTDILTFVKGYQPADEENGEFMPYVIGKDSERQTKFTITEVISGISKVYKKVMKDTALHLAVEKKKEELSNK